MERLLDVTANIIRHVIVKPHIWFNLWRIKSEKITENVDKEEYERLKIKYLLNQDKLKMLQENYEHYHDIYLEHKNAYEKYVNHCLE